MEGFWRSSGQIKATSFGCDLAFSYVLATQSAEEFFEHRLLRTLKSFGVQEGGIGRVEEPEMPGCLGTPPPPPPQKKKKRGGANPKPLGFRVSGLGILFLNPKPKVSNQNPTTLSHSTLCVLKTSRSMSMPSAMALVTHSRVHRHRLNCQLLAAFAAFAIEGFLGASASLLMCSAVSAICPT